MAKKQPRPANPPRNHFQTLQAAATARTTCPTCDQPLAGKAARMARLAWRAHLGATQLSSTDRQQPDLRPLFTDIPRPAGLTVDGGIVFGPPAYRLVEHEWRKLVDDLRDLVQAVEQWRTLKRPKTMKEAIAAGARFTKAMGVVNRFSKVWGHITNSLYVFEPTSGRVFFDPGYFSRQHKKLGAYLWPFVDLVRRLHDVGVPESRGARSKHLTEQQLLEIARAHHAGLGDVRIARAVLKADKYDIAAVERVREARLSMGLRRLTRGFQPGA